MRRYHQLAENVSAYIRRGVLRPGDRLPSVRAVSRREHISPATVVQAYKLLEDRGEIRSRHRSGHYVAAQLGPGPLPEPAVSVPAADAPAAVNMRELIFNMLDVQRIAGVTPLGSAFPDASLFPLTKLARAAGAAARKLNPQSIYDQMPPGNAELRRLIARRYLDFGCDVPLEEIVITSGALEALYLSIATATKPGDVVAIECPAFYLMLNAIERLGLKAIQIETHPREGMSVSALADALKRHPVKVCWLMTNFQNPLGALMPEATKRELVKLLAAHDVLLIEDDAYGELFFGSRLPKPAKAFDRSGRIMHCGSFSKCLAPGYRVGWVAAGGRAKEIERTKVMATIATSAPTQSAIVEYLKHGGYQSHLRRLRATLEEQQVRMLQAVARHFPSGTRVTRPLGGYFLWVEMPLKVDSLEVHRLACKQKITVAPGPMFSPQHDHKNCLRINYGIRWTPQTEAAVAALGRIVTSLA